MATIPSTISGMTFSQAKLIADCEFGCKVFNVSYNADRRRYEIYLMSPINKDSIKTLKKTLDGLSIIPVRFVDVYGSPIIINDESSNKKNIPSTIKGLTLSQAKRIPNGKFGEDYIKTEPNLNDKLYDVYISSTDNKRMIEFQEGYKNRFRVISVIFDSPI